MKQKKRITESQVESWIGGDNLSVDHLIGLLTELANGEYTIPEFRMDVLEFADEVDEYA